MEGTIKIEAIPDKGLAVEMSIRHISLLDKFTVIDGLIDAFEMGKTEKKILSTIIDAGGLGSLFGVKKQRIDVDKEAFELFKEMKGDSNETDAH